MADDLSKIIAVCSQGRQINNFQMRAFFISISAKLKQNIQQYRQNENQCMVANEAKNCIQQKIQQLKKQIQDKFVIKSLNQLDKQSFCLKPVQSYKNLKQFNQKLVNQFSAIGSQLQNIKIQLNKIPFLQKNIRTLDEKSQNNLRHCERKLQANFLQQKEKLQKIQNFFTLQQRRFIQNYGIKRVRSFEWVDPYCQSYGNLSFINSTILALKNVKIFGNKQIRQKSKFRLKIMNTHGDLGIGIVNSQYKNLTDFTDLSQSHRIVYWNNSELYNCKVLNKTGKGFYQNDEITVEVNLKTTSIKWQIGNKQSIQIQNQLIKNQEIKWVPIIFLSQKGGVEIMPC